MQRSIACLFASALLSGAACSAGDDGDSPGAGGSSATGSASSGASSSHSGSTSQTSSATSSVGGAGPGGGGAAGSSGDADGDGLDDAYEAQIAATYRPFLSVAPDDGCPLGGILYRVRPYPDATTPSGMLFVFYDYLYQKDCGLGGHIGDDEGFGVMIDPSKPAPDGIIAIHAIGHQNTACEQVSECGVCGDRPACTLADIGTTPTPVLFASKDKHASYADKSRCMPLTTCLDTCALAQTSADPPMVNAGEPDAHLVEDLTDQGFITAANGWSEMSLFHFNPWAAGVKFGGAGVVADDLVDASFVPAACP